MDNNASYEKSLTAILAEMSSAIVELSTRIPEIQKFLEYVREAEAKKVLDEKTKHLIALGIAIAIRCEPCIMWHTNAAVRAGATLDEILETIKIAIAMGGGPALAYAALKAYKAAKELLT